MNELSSNELTTLAYKKVKAMILSNQLKPGQKIVQDKLALDLGISRTPLRSALQMLEAEYLVESIPRKGVVVRRFSDEQIIEVYDCRIALEGMAIRCFTETATQSKINKLRKFFHLYRTKAEEIDEEAYQKEDIKFHDFLIQNCGNDFLIRLFQQGNLLEFIAQIGLIRSPEETLPEHLSIIEAISDRDIDLAEQLGKNHLLISKNLVMEKINKKSE